MKEGDLVVGAFTHCQIGYNRPLPGAGHHRGVLKGLADLELPVPWAPAPAETMPERL